MNPALQQIERALAGFAGDGVAIAVTDPRAPQPDLLAGEGTAVANAIPARQREFAAGRAAARRAMGVDLPIPAATDRAPVWPEGWQGSISHCRTLCIAVATRTGQSLGIDIEDAAPLDEDLIATICDETELSDLPEGARATHAKRIFSAKEAAFKAQYPLTRLLFGFDHMHVDFRDQSFTATFRQPAAPFAIGDTLQGRQIAVAGHLVSLVAIGQAAGTGA